MTTGVLLETGKNAAGSIPVAGIAIALACLAAAGIALAITIPKLISKNSKSETEKATEDVRSLSAEIYNLQKSTTAIKTAISEFENLDNMLDFLRFLPDNSRRIFTKGIKYRLELPTETANNFHRILNEYGKFVGKSSLAAAHTHEHWREL